MKILLAQFTLLAMFVSSTVAVAAPYDQWKHSGSVFVLTTPAGANLPATASVDGFPLLVRLHKDFFEFSQAKPQGEDLRFSATDGEPLAYQIEDWDAVAGNASIWVRMPTIKGNARQQLQLHWGNEAAASESNGKSVFNESNGYLSVWHLHAGAKDEVGTLTSEDKGTSDSAGIIGRARHFPGQKGIFCGDKIPNYPAGAGSHSTEAWFRTEKPNTTLIGWGNEGGGRGSKVRMLFRSPPHIKIDSDFSDVKSDSQLPLGEWIHIIHTYDREDGKLYINGQLDGSAKPLLNIKTPARCWLGGWYNQYDFVGDLDEVRISKVARSAEWIKLQYENQKPLQTLVGPIVQPGSKFSVSHSELSIAEGQTATIIAQAGGAQKVSWILKRDGRETVVATDRFSFTLDAGRVVGDQPLTLKFQAVYADDVKTKEILVLIKEALPEPDFTLTAPASWDGRQLVEVVPQITNLRNLQDKNAGKLNYAWKVSGIAAIKEIQPGKLLLKRSQNSGQLTVTLAIDNGGVATERSTTIRVQEPAHDAWSIRKPAPDEKPLEGQFYARDDKNEGTLHYNGTLGAAADEVFLKLYSDDKLVSTVSQPPAADKSYALSVKLKPGLIKYKIEFGAKSGGVETLVDTIPNLICGDAYLIDGQSNAEATDVGKDDPTYTSDWIRSFGSTSGSPDGARLKRWGNAVVRDRMGGKFQIGYWGLELGKRIVEGQKMPVCIINGAVGGTRIDQHQRNAADPTDASTIYGRLLWRVQQARLTHGIRGVLWHQGENDQGADGPTGGFGWETYQPYFVDMAAAWKEDYPNIQQYYTFQIWPKACAMGINGSDNRLREVQRQLPALYSNLHVMSTLGIKPPGGCHYPIAGYAEFANLIGPLVERDHYGAKFTQSITAPNLRRAYFTNAQRDEIALEFDQEVVWNDALASQFQITGEPKLVDSGKGVGKLVTLSLKSPAKGDKLTYLDSATWSPENLLYGVNGIAALTFCEVPIRTAK